MRFVLSLRLLGIKLLGDFIHIDWRTLVRFSGMSQPFSWFWCRIERATPRSTSTSGLIGAAGDLYAS